MFALSLPTRLFVYAWQFSFLLALSATLFSVSAQSLAHHPSPAHPHHHPPTLTGDFQLKKVTPVAEGMSALVLQAKLHAGIAKGRDSLRHVDGPVDNFEALRAGVCFRACVGGRFG